jgi:hypothetical protein
MEKNKPAKAPSFLTYRDDWNNPNKKKAVLTRQEQWEEDWLTWWYRRGMISGETRS